MYTVSAEGSLSNADKFILVVMPTRTAYNYISKEDSNCSAVNKNDYLGSVQFYNAEGFKLTGTYSVEAHFFNGSVNKDVGTATYDAYSDRVILKSTNVPICLSTISTIVFTSSS